MIGCIEQMLKDILIHARAHKIQRKMPNIWVDLCHVCILTRATVLITKCTKQGVLCVSIFALSALHPLAMSLTIPLRNVEIS